MASQESWLVTFVFGLMPGGLAALIIAMIAAKMDNYTLFIIAGVALFVVAAIWATLSTVIPRRA